MKKMILAILFSGSTLVTATAFADEVTTEETAPTRTTYVNGYGREYGFCDSAGGSFCIDTIKRRAEDDGKRDGQMRCQTSGGRPTYAIPYCSSRCSPNYIPPGSPRQNVICDATCQVQCEMPN